MEWSRYPLLDTSTTVRSTMIRLNEPCCPPEYNFLRSRLNQTKSSQIADTACRRRLQSINSNSAAENYNRWSCYKSTSHSSIGRELATGTHWRIIWWVSRSAVHSYPVNSRLMPSTSAHMRLRKARTSLDTLRIRLDNEYCIESHQDVSTPTSGKNTAQANRIRWDETWTSEYPSPKLYQSLYNQQSKSIRFPVLHMCW